jgi:hypothetical protein
MTNRFLSKGTRFRPEPGPPASVDSFYHEGIVGPTKQRQNDHSTSPTIIVKPQSELINTQSCNYKIEACEQNVLIRFLIKDLIVLRTSVKVHSFLIIKRENLFAGSYINITWIIILKT